jgi:WD40 repeat protein
VFALSFSPDGSLVVSASEDHTLKAWETAAAPDPAVFPTQTMHANEGLVFAPDGQAVAVGANFGVTLLDLQTGQETQYQATGGAAFLPSGKTVVMGGGVLGDRVLLLERASGRWLPGLKGVLADLPSKLVLSPDGKTLATVPTPGFGYDAKLWDMTSRKPLGVVSGHAERASATCAAFSPDGQRLATGGLDGLVKIWDVATQREISSWRHGQEVSAVAFSPDGQLLAAAGGTSLRQYVPGEVKLWDAARGEERATLRRHSRTVTCLAFSPDGKRLATGSEDKTVQLWLPATGQYLTTLQGTARPIRGVAFRPDGRSLAAVDGNGTVLLWHTAVEAEVKP